MTVYKTAVARLFLEAASPCAGPTSPWFQDAGCGAQTQLAYPPQDTAGC